MADHTSLAGRWVEVKPNSFPPEARKYETGPQYAILIAGDEITINWHDKPFYQTIFRLEENNSGVELKNTKKRENWEQYAEFNQYEQFGHFERFMIIDSKLTGFIFIADKGYRQVPFEKRP